MLGYSNMSQNELLEEKSRLTAIHNDFIAKGLDLNMARGKPNAEQIALALPMLDILNSKSNLIDASGADCANFGELLGIPEARSLFADYFGVTKDEVIVVGSSSLTFMYDCLARAMYAGVVGSKKPWGQAGKVKFICPVPGYDRHFAMCEILGIEMIPIPQSAEGPDMDLVEQLVAGDEAIKGIWCVPKYSNPLGCVYSDETIKRFARLKPAAEDFRIFWDNAYHMHYVYNDIPVLNLLEECKKSGNPNIAYMFGSTSKFTIPGAGVAFFAASEENIKFISNQLASQAISWDKINMLRHVRFLKNVENIKSLMDRHAAVLRTRFDAVLDILESELSGSDAGQWVKPDGGYFITFVAEKFCAKRIVSLCKEAGVVITDAGATHPHHNDPDDAYIRLAPSFPDVESLRTAMQVFCNAAKISKVEMMINGRDRLC